MSTSTLYIANKNGVRQVAEFQNAYGTAPVLWRYLCKEYLKQEPEYWLSIAEGDKSLWRLVNNPMVPLSLRLVHAFTFNNAVCHSDKKQILAEALLDTYRVTHDFSPDYVNHWQNMGHLIKTMKPFPKSQGIGLNCTGIYDSWIEWKRGARKVQNIFDLIKEVK